MNRNSKPFVSVVTPFYNTEEHLTECISSVLRQSYSDWEYILLDNCSTDGSSRIAEKYARQDSRIRIVRSSLFRNQVQNYNHALQQISQDSKYSKIVEADNWIFPECLEQMVNLAEKHPSIGIVEAYQLQGTALRLDGLPYQSKFLSGRDACRFQLLHYPDGWIFGPPTSHLIRSDLVRERFLFYDENSLCEDMESHYDLLRQNDFGFVHQVLTFERVHHGKESVTGSIDDFGPWLLHAYIAINKYGPVYLNQEEYEQRLKAISERYFRFLGHAMLTAKDFRFWKYHEQGLASFGGKLSSLRLGRYAVRALMSRILDPKNLTRYLFQFLRRRRPTVR